jgi:rare lipoprotein A
VKKSHKAESIAWLTVLVLALSPGLAGGEKKGNVKAAGKAYTEEGLASWYGRKFHGKKTASGERFNMYKKTAAHRTLPFGTKVKVTNLGNKKSVVVRINDRGPFVKGRIIDLSYAAAKDIGMIKKGVVKVRIKVVKK